MALTIMMMEIDRAIILAAGSSSRLGRPKALIQVGEITLIEMIASRLEEVGLSVTIVTRKELADRIRLLLPEHHVVVNLEPEKGRTGSVQCGLESVGKIPVLIVPIDRPGFSVQTLHKLCHSEVTACPVKDGKGGHPLALSIEDSNNILNENPNQPLRSLISPSRIEVDDPYLHLNIDMEEDVEHLLKVVDDL